MVIAFIFYVLCKNLETMLYIWVYCAYIFNHIKNIDTDFMLVYFSVFNTWILLFIQNFFQNDSNLRIRKIM